MKRAALLSLSCLCLLVSCARSPASGQEPTREAVSLQSAYTDDPYVRECIDLFLFDGQSLPDATPLHTLSWEVTSGQAELHDNIITKTAEAAEYEPISLRVTYGEEQIEFSDLTLCDPQVGYVIVYFTSEGPDQEQLKLAYTYNCEYWFKINMDRGILKPSIGTGRLRDPSLVRRKEGGFTLLATQGYDTDSIYAFDTMNLAEYTNERVLKLNASSDNSMSETQAWAPEAIYNHELGQYVILFSSPNDGGSFYSLTEDFEKVSYPAPLLEPGYPTIDLTLTRTSNGWVGLLKDEREPMEAYSRILRANGLCIGDLTVEAKPVFPRQQMEGPMIMKSLEKEGWYIFTDDYTRSSYKGFYTKDITSGTLEELDDTDLMIPLEQPSHGYALPVTWKELERIWEVYPEP